MKELIEFTATRFLGHHNDITIKALRRELARMARAPVPEHARVEIEPYSAREGTPAYHRQLGRALVRLRMSVIRSCAR